MSPAPSNDWSKELLATLDMMQPGDPLAALIVDKLAARSLIGGEELARLLEDGVIDADPKHVNAASIDVRLGSEFFFEDDAGFGFLAADLSKKDPRLAFRRLEARAEDRIDLEPGEFFLAHTRETLALPDDVSCLFLLRSSCARAGLEHSQAGFGDAGFTGQLTLELKNITRHHVLYLRPGMRIGQILFLRHAHAGERSYRHKGRYGGQAGVQVSKGAG